MQSKLQFRWSNYQHACWWPLYAGCLVENISADQKRQIFTVCIDESHCVIFEAALLLLITTGAYISENSTHYFLPDWAYLGQESCQITVKEYSEHKIKAIFELSTHENPYVDSLFGLIYEFLIFLFFIFLSYLPKTRDLSWVVGGMYAPVPSGQKHALLWLESQGMPIISLLKLIGKCKLTLFFSQKATRISMKRLSNDDNWFVCPSSKLYQSQRSSYWVIRWYRSANLSRKNQLKLNQNETKRSSFLSLVFYIQLFRQHIQSSNLRQSRDSSWIQLCIASCAKLLLPASLFTANWFMAIISYFSLQLNSPVSLLKTLRRRVSLPFLSMPHTLHKRFHTASIFGIVQISKYYPNIP